VTPTRTMVPDFDDYGLGCVLLAGSEAAKLADATKRQADDGRPGHHIAYAGCPFF